MWTVPKGGGKKASTKGKWKSSSRKGGKTQRKKKKGERTRTGVLHPKTMGNLRLGGWWIFNLQDRRKLYKKKNAIVKSVEKTSGGP